MSFPTSDITNKIPSLITTFILLRCRKLEKMKNWVPGEETGRAVGTVTFLLGSDGDIEIELESSPKGLSETGRTEKYLEGYIPGGNSFWQVAGRIRNGDKAAELAVSLVGLKSHLDLVNFNQYPALQ